MNSLFISHGGGPLPLLGDARHAQMVHCLKEMATKLRKPDALIVVSAHWEEEVPTITAGAKPALIYDYFGFPPESYEIQYPCSGAPALARRMNELFAAAGIRA
ncbi:MAG TPA: class III extradiol ring-cleavage dioxygenase, partial [Burkholderiaceae bacterium]|nr:class III extradiol ring-cleavage dioxygenase [Burkholderiaceae bacterium]